MDKEIIKTIRELHKEGQKNKAEIARICNVSYNSVKYYTSVKYDDILLRQTAKDKVDKEFEQIVIKILPECNSYNNVCARLGLRGVEGYYNKIKTIVEKNNLDISHFGSVKINKYNSFDPAPDEEFFIKCKKQNHCSVIKRLIAHSYKEYRCENPECGIKEWNGKPITLQLHHINGDNKDNTLENLQLLCPNCHSQTENYGKKKNFIRQRENKFLVTEKIKEELSNKIGYNPTKEISSEKIIEVFKKTKSFRGAGKILGISDNGLRKKSKKLRIFENLLDIKKDIKI